MKNGIQIVGVLLLLAITQPSFSQSKKEEAAAKGRLAIRLEDEGKVDEAITLLEEARKLDEDNRVYMYELALAYYLKKEFNKAIDLLEKTVKYRDVQDADYQLLGNAYDNIGKSEKAIDTYDKGLKKFPKSGSLYLERGIMEMGKKEYNKALNFYEKGIEAAPEFPSNYYWAARIFCSSTEELWGMIYGEIFLNLEPNTKRTKEISKLLYDTYKSEIKVESDTSWSVSFSKNNTMTLEDLKSGKLPYGVSVYEPIVMLSMLSAGKSVDLASLDKMRSQFVDMYFEKNHDKKYPNVLFSFQKKIKNAGHMEAYNYWVLSNGDPEGFAKWQAANKSKWDAFIVWFNDNAINIDETNRFHRWLY